MNETKIVIISMTADYRAKTDIGGAYTVYLQGDKYYLKDESSLFPSQEISLLEMGRVLMKEQNYNLTPVGRAMRFDPRWESLLRRAEFDNIDQWAETGEEMEAIQIRHAELRKELELIK